MTTCNIKKNIPYWQMPEFQPYNVDGSLKAWWTADFGTSILTDRSGNGNDLSIGSLVTRPLADSSGIFGQAHDVTDGNMVIGATPSITMTNGLTIDMTINCVDTSGMQTLLGKGGILGNTVPYGEYSIAIYNGLLYFDITDGITRSNIINYTLTPGIHRILALFTGNNLLKLLVDDVDGTPFGIISSIINRNKNLNVGIFSGIIYECKIYNRELTQTENDYNKSHSYIQYIKNKI